jgi:ABC-type sulfate/molybdate transport systems ATPase subunit
MFDHPPEPVQNQGNPALRHRIVPHQIDLNELVGQAVRHPIRLSNGQSMIAASPSILAPPPPVLD